MGSNDRKSKSTCFIRDKIRKIFLKAQEQFRHHVLIEKCKALYEECSGGDSFLTEFKTALRYSLVFPEKEAAENILSFVGKFVVLLYSLESHNDEMDCSDTINEDCTFPSSILELLFKTHGASLTLVRLRCLQLLNKVLSGMPENSTISDSVWVKLKDTLLTRIQDKSPTVRVQAVLTARKLQDPKSLNCEIIKALVFHLNDPSSAVRRAVVSSIAFNKVTIGHVLARTRDVNDNVRRNTYVVFSKIRVLNLTIKYRLTILERGLKDRSVLVRNCVRSILLVNWLENFDKDVLKFLEALDVINCPDLVLTIIENIFKIVSLEEILKLLPINEDNKLIPVEKLTPEMAILWRAVCHHMWKQNNEEGLDKVLPNITVFCDYIRIFYPLHKDKAPESSLEEKWKEVKEKETLRHLLEIIKVFDYRDEMGRSNLKKLMFDILSSQRIGNDAVECLIELLASVVPSPEAFLQEVTEIISEIREPLVVETVQLSRREQMEIEINISNLKVTLNDLREKEYDAVSSKDYARAQNIKAEIEKTEEELRILRSKTCQSQETREEKNDPVTVCKCLTILTNMIKYSKVRTLTPTLRNIKENFLNQCLTSHDLLTQSLSVLVLGQFCVLDLDVAKENIFRFILMLSENGEDEINTPALKSIFDILLYYGVQPFENLHDCGDDGAKGKGQTTHTNEDDLFTDSEERNGPKFIAILSELLNCKTNDVLKSVAFEGLCKLLFSGILYSPNTLEKIIIKGFSPIIDNESEDFIRQVFIVFFPAFASVTPKSQEMIEAAFIPTLKRLTSAALGTPEADINPKEVALFLIEHTRPEINSHSDLTLHVHNNLAMSICHEILKECDECGESDVFHLYLNSLLQLQLSLVNEIYVNHLRVLIDKIKKELDDRIMLRQLNEFKKKIEGSCHNTLTSIENTLVTGVNSTIESNEVVTENETEEWSNAMGICSVSEKLSEQTIENRRVTRDDSLESNESLGSPGRKSQFHVIPESPDMSD